jgi:hypothetical protein
MSATEEHATMIIDCEKRESKLTEWEREFIDSVSRQIENRSLSAKQAETLERIWDRVTS